MPAGFTLQTERCEMLLETTQRDGRVSCVTDFQTRPRAEGNSFMALGISSVSLWPSRADNLLCFHSAAL